MMLIMALWGRFPFSINTAAFQELNRDTAWRWPSQELFGQLPLSHFVGPGDDTITLPGVIYPEFRGGTGQIDDMRALASNGTPELLIDGRGNILGKWACTSISEKQGPFAGLGIPLKQEFTISLKRVPDPLSGNLLLSAIKKKFGVDLSRVKNVVQLAKSAAGAAQTTLAQAKSAVQTAAGVIGAPAALIIAEVDKSSRAAEAFKDLGTRALDIAGTRPTVPSVTSALGLLVAGVPNLSAQATSASRALDGLAQTVIENATPIAGVIAANAALVAANKLTALTSSTWHTARAEEEGLAAS
jgi:phage protein U